MLFLNLAARRTWQQSRLVIEAETLSGHILRKVHSWRWHPVTFSLPYRWHDIPLASVPVISRRSRLVPSKLFPFIPCQMYAQIRNLHKSLHDTRVHWSQWSSIIARPSITLETAPSCLFPCVHNAFTSLLTLTPFAEHGTLCFTETQLDRFLSRFFKFC